MDERIILKGISDTGCGGLDVCGYEDSIKVGIKHGLYDFERL